MSIRAIRGEAGKQHVPRSWHGYLEIILQSLDALNPWVKRPGEMRRKSPHGFKAYMDTAPAALVAAGNGLKSHRASAGATAPPNTADPFGRKILGRKISGFPQTKILRRLHSVPAFIKTPPAVLRKSSCPQSSCQTSGGSGRFEAHAKPRRARERSMGSGCQSFT